MHVNIDCILFSTGSSEQLLSPDCWKASLKVLGCSSHPKIKTAKTRSILLSPQQVTQHTLFILYFSCIIPVHRLCFTIVLYSRWMRQLSGSQSTS